MTPEQKAKAYDKALEIARKELQTCGSTDCDAARQIYRFFPELKESEDEKIRKEIMEYVKNTPAAPGGHIEQQVLSRWIAWLEKQEGCECIKKDWLEHIKQSWYKEGFIDGKYSGGTSKEWTINDAAIFKEIIDFLENGTAKLQHDLTKYANWLKIQFTPIEKQGRQFSVDKLKPKFHEGEWITNGDYTWKIVDVKPLDYILQSQDGNIVDDTISHVDEQFHSFTIKDAKDGDVLYCESSGIEYIIILKQINNRSLDSYCRYNTVDGFAIDVPRVMSIQNNPKPATKEQRDTLLKAMTDAGYTFDFEKKELKKIEQKPAWSEEDEARYESCIKVLQTSDGYDTINTRWFKSLKDRVQPQPQQEWSEEDEEMWLDAIKYLELLDAQGIYGNKAVPCINWLKSLKDRHSWKPSDEQIKILNEILNFAANHESPYWNDYIFGTLNNLIRQLKKLIE